MTALPGLTDRELTDRLFDAGADQQAVNQAARALATTGQVLRRRRRDGKTGNYMAGASGLAIEEAKVSEGSRSEMLSEDEVKRRLEEWLKAAGWEVSVIWGRGQGIDVEAVRDHQRWIIEVKGCGSLDPMRVNYFLSVLGELLQRMNDPDARYSIALPEMRQFRGLWQRLPELAKSRTGITVLFVDPSGTVEEVSAAK